MFTIKLYSNYQNGVWSRQRIYSAESFTVLRGNDGTAEITLHQKNANDDSRVDIEWEGYSKSNSTGGPPTFEKAVIENASGRTSEIIGLGPDPRKAGNTKSLDQSRFPANPN